MKKAMTFVFSLFLIFMPFLSKVQASNEPQGVLHKAVVDRLFMGIRAMSIFLTMDNYNYNKQHSVELCFRGEEAFKKFGVDYRVLVCYYKDGDVKATILTSQTEDGVQKTYVCDIYQALMCWIRTYNESLARQYLFRYAKSDDICSVFPAEVGHFREVIYLDKNGEEVRKDVFA